MSVRRFVVVFVGHYLMGSTCRCKHVTDEESNSQASKVSEVVNVWTKVNEEQEENVHQRTQYRLTDGTSSVNCDCSKHSKDCAGGTHRDDTKLY